MKNVNASKIESSAKIKSFSGNLDKRSFAALAVSAFVTIPTVIFVPVIANNVSTAPTWAIYTMGYVAAGVSAFVLSSLVFKFVK